MEFEGHCFVLTVSPLWVSPVVQDLGYFFESFVKDCKVVVPFHVFLLALCYYSGELDEYCFCHGVMSFCEGICFIVTCFNPRFPACCNLSSAVVVDSYLQFVY